MLIAEVVHMRFSCEGCFLAQIGIGVLAWPELDFCKEEKGEERTFETWRWLREPVTSGTFIEWHFIPTTHLKKVFLHCKPTEFLFFRHGTISSICPRPP